MKKGNKNQKIIVVALITLMVLVLAITGFTIHKKNVEKEEARIAAEEAEREAAKEAEALEKAAKEAEAKALEDARIAEEKAAKEQEKEELKALAVAIEEAEKEEESKEVEVTPAPELAKPKVVVCIDPGHGGDGGNNHGVEAEYNGVMIMEKNLNLAIATKVKNYLEQTGRITVVMTRTGDYAVGLSDRVNIGVNNGADYFVSIHNNSSSSGNPADSGCLVICTQSHYNGVYDDSVGMAKSILPRLQSLGLNLTSDWDANTHGGLLQRTSGSGATYPDGSAKDFYAIINGCTSAGLPSIIVEHAFVSCPSDYQNYLSDDGKLDALARADADGIIAFLSGKGLM